MRPILSSIAVLYHVNDYSVAAKGAIDLFSLYVLFSQFRPHDAVQGICLLSFRSLIMHTHARGCTCIRRNLKKTVLWGTITWSEMGKQNIHAKKVYYVNGNN